MIGSFGSITGESMDRAQNNCYRADSVQCTTDMLKRWAAGSDRAAEQLMGRLYPDLLAMAGRQGELLRLTATRSDLAQELCIRILEQRSTNWQGRAHFFAIAAKLVRRIAVDRLRWETREKRGGGQKAVGIEEVGPIMPEFDFDLLALDRALSRLADGSPSIALVVELKFFAGLSIEETAEILEIGRTTVIRRWRFARAWLGAAMKGEAPELEAGN